MEDLTFILACTICVLVIFVAGFVLGMLHGGREDSKNINEKLKK